MPDRMTIAETQALDTLDPVPEYSTNKNVTQPFNVSPNPFKYKPTDLAKGESDQDRTDWFKKALFMIWKETGRSVPYAFKSRDGAIRSLDAGCLGHLYNRTRPEIGLELDDERYIVAVHPTSALIELCDKIPVDALRRRVGIETSAPLDQSNDITLASQPSSPQVSTLSRSDPLEPLALPFDLVEPVDERRKQESERVIREGQEKFRCTLLDVWKSSCAIHVPRSQKSWKPRTSIDIWDHKQMIREMVCSCEPICTVFSTRICFAFVTMAIAW